MGCRGLLATQDCQSGGTVLLLPWKHVLGMRAARQIIEEETSKGRGMDDDDFFLNLIVVCEGFEQRLWSCVMASAILAGLRYPLSSWSPYISSLPHPSHNKSDNDDDENSENRVEMALRRTHALAARQSMKRHFKRDRSDQKLSQSALQELRRVRTEIMSTDATNDSALNHVLLWTNESLRDTHDDTLQQEVTRDAEWLISIWEQLFQTQRQDHNHSSQETNNEHESKDASILTTELDKNGTIPAPETTLPHVHPVVSLQSWLWAHAIVRSRAIGFDHAPKQIMTCEYQSCIFRSHGVLLPIIDLINHCSSLSSNAALEIRSDGVAVVATRLIQEHEEVLFDYHPNATLSLLLRNYGFVDGIDLTSSSPCRQRQVLTTWNGMVQIDIETTCSSSPATTTKPQMLTLISSCFHQQQGQWILMVRDETAVLPLQQQQQQSLDTWFAINRMAASACFLLMQQFADDGEGSLSQAGKNATAVSYRDATHQLVRRAYEDLSAVCNLMESE